jgi:Transglycosylase SLT domain
VAATVSISSQSRYILSDGSESSSRSSAVGISEGDLIIFWQAYSSRIPPGYALGVAKHESGMEGGLYVTNEHDTDTKTKDDGTVVVYDSYGIFQMGKTEAIKAHVIPTADALIDPENNVKCAAIVFESNLDKILAAFRDKYGYETPLTDDVWRYCAWGHNAGIDEPVKSIATYGMDWQAALNRNQNEWFYNKLVPYTDDVVAEIQRTSAIPLGDGGSNHYEEENYGLIAGAIIVGGWLLSRGV